MDSFFPNPEQPLDLGGGPTSYPVGVLFSDKKLHVDPVILHDTEITNFTYLYARQEHRRTGSEPFASDHTHVKGNPRFQPSILERRAKWFEEKYPDKKVKLYGDPRDVMGDDSIDVVTIATPNHWHTLAAIWAMEAGKDVYVEKPLSHSVWEGRQLVAAVPELGGYIKKLKKRGRGRATVPLRRLLKMMRDYPRASFLQAIRDADHYGLYDLERVDRMAIRNVARDFFPVTETDDGQADPARRDRDDDDE